MSGDLLDDFERMAAVIRAAVKAKSDVYRELERVECHCSSERLHAVYAGPTGQLWLWIAGIRGLVNHPGESPTEDPVRVERIRPRAMPIPAAPGEIVWTADVSQCPRCKTSALLRPGIGGVLVTPLGAPTHGRVADG